MRSCSLLPVFVTGLLVCCLFTIAASQGIQTTPYSSPSLLRGFSGQGSDMAPSNPLRTPGTSGPWSSAGSDSVTLSSGMFQGLLPPIPNLQLGYLYSFSNNSGAGRVTGDYLKPFSLTKESFVFGEAHVEGWNFWSSGGTNGNSGGRVNNRVDVSLGGGYRKFFGDQALIGINGFYDTTRLTGNWYSSGSLGFQAAWLMSGSDALDLNFNWYGKLLEGPEWINTFRHGPSNYDFEAGYSHELWNGGPDLRLKIKGYHFDVGSNLNGWNGGAELKSRDGMFVLKYEAGHDRLDSTYQTIGGYVNVGFQVENLLKGESPFSPPTPIFRSPRNLSYMANQPAGRNWSQPTAVVVTRPGQALASSGGGNLSVFFGDIPMVLGGLFAFVSDPYPFDFPSTVPVASLDPDANMTYQFSFDSDASADSTWEVFVAASTGTEFLAGDVAFNGASGSVGPVPLNAAGSLGPPFNQSAFTIPGTTPTRLTLHITRFAGSTVPTYVNVSNAVVYFNQ